MHSATNFSFNDLSAMRSNSMSDLDSSRHSTATASSVKTGPNTVQNNNNMPVLVHPDAVPGMQFTPERYAKGQCIEFMRYTVTDGSEMHQYFHPLLAEAICKASALPNHIPKHPLLGEIATRIAVDKSLLKIQHIEYGQLEHLKNPDISLRPPPQNDPDYMPDNEFISYIGLKPLQKKKTAEAERERMQIVQAPRCLGGLHYVPTPVRSRQFKVTFVVKVDKPGGSVLLSMHDAVKIRLGVRKPPEIYLPDQKPQEQAIEIQVGLYKDLDFSFTPYNITDQPSNNRVLLTDRELSWALFYQVNRSGASWPKWNAPIPEGMEPARIYQQLDDGLSSVSSAQRFKLHEKDFKMAYYQPGKKQDEGHWVAVTNFVLKEFAGILQFTENIGSEPYLKVICRLVLDHNKDHVIYLAADDRFRVPSLDAAGAIDVEVLIQPGKLRSSSDVSALFASFCGMLVATTMTPDMLRCWLSDQVRPMITECIVRFGRQKNGMFVASNVVFNKEHVWSHEKAMICVVPTHFTGQTVPMPVSDFPRNIICPFCHVRYCIGLLFMDIMGKIFCNNKMPAFAVFAGGVMHLYAHNFWNGETGFGKGVPYVWAYSELPGSGKTESLSAVQSLMGFNHVAPIGGDATIPAIVHKAADHQACLTLCIDDVVVRADDDGMNKLGRMMFDRCGRTVFGRKAQVIQSSMICTVSGCALALHARPLALARCH